MIINQFDIYQNPIAKSRKTYPFVCVLQNNIYQGLSSRLVAFVTHDESLVMDRLSVKIEVDTECYFVCINVIFTMESARLKHFIANSSEKRDELLNAYDALFTGI